MIFIPVSVQPVIKLTRTNVKTETTATEIKISSRSIQSILEILLIDFRNIIDQLEIRIIWTRKMYLQNIEYGFWSTI